MTVFLNVGGVKFYYEATTTAEVGPAIIKITGADLHRDPGLESSVLIALLSDARCRDQDKLPHPDSSRRGYFGSLLDDVEFGSRIWLLERSLIETTTLRHFEQYASDALQWMVVDGLASEIIAVASRAGMYQINWSVAIVRPTSTVRFKFFINWEYQTYGNIE